MQFYKRRLKFEQTFLIELFYKHRFKIVFVNYTQIL